MKSTNKFAAIIAAAASTVLICAGGAHAQNRDGSLLGILDTPSIVLGCFPTGQVGQGNSFQGTQNVSCSPSATAPAGNGGSGAGGVTGAEIVQGPSIQLEPGQRGDVSADCPDGKIATGGGYYAFAPTGTNAFRADFSQPLSLAGSNEPVTWFVDGVNEGTGTLTVHAYAVCVDSAE